MRSWILCLILLLLATVQTVAGASDDCPYMQSTLHPLFVYRYDVRVIKSPVVKKDKEKISLSEGVGLKDGTTVMHDLVVSCMMINDKLVFSQVNGLKKNMSKKRILRILKKLINKIPQTSEATLVSKDDYLNYISQLDFSGALFHDGILEHDGEMSSYGIEMHNDGMISVYYEQRE